MNVYFLGIGAVFVVFGAAVFVAALVWLVLADDRRTIAKLQKGADEVEIVPLPPRSSNESEEWYTPPDVDRQGVYSLQESEQQHQAELLHG